MLITPDITVWKAPTKVNAGLFPFCTYLPLLLNTGYSVKEAQSVISTLEVVRSIDVPFQEAHR